MPKTYDLVSLPSYLTLPTIESEDVHSFTRPGNHWMSHFRSEIKKFAWAQEGVDDEDRARVLNAFDHPSLMVVIWCQFFAIKWKTDGFEMGRNPKGNTQGRARDISLILVTGKRQRQILFHESCLVEADSVMKFAYYVSLMPLAERISVPLAESQQPSVRTLKRALILNI